MSVYVKGMEMPDDCRDCPFENYYNSYGITKCFATGKAMTVNWRCIPWEGRAEWCPLVEVPTPHGRLIDADRVIHEMNEMHVAGATFVVAVEYVKLINADAPTVIEAEDG